MPDSYLDTLRALLDATGGGDGGAQQPAEASAADSTATAATAAAAERSRRAARLDIFHEKKGRGGKQALIVAGFPADVGHDELAALASQLKRRLGVGGSARGGEILIQGADRAALAAALAALGWRTKS